MNNIITIILMIKYIILLLCMSKAFSFKKILFKTNIITPNIYSISNPNTVEHIFPKSLMKYNNNDLHNLFICNNKINNLRSNYKYVDENDIKFDNTWIKLENNNYVNQYKSLFIPNNYSKGIIARAIMYMAYTYKYNYKKIINTDNLLEWCIRYPPTKEEYNHNNLVFIYQKRRNHFIDLYYKKNYKNIIINIFYTY